MQTDTVERMINPYNGQRLYKERIYGEEYLVDHSGNRIPVIDGIPDFTVLENTMGLNQKYRKLYDRISKLNDLAEFIYSLFYDLKKLRREWMKELEVKPGYRVLETSAGTGLNFRFLPRLAEYYGVDISRGMLMQAQKNSIKWELDIKLFQGNAEYLPFANHMFDSVFHVGGINFFNDRKKAIEEMIRVAKPGTKIVIIDETEELVRKQYRKMPFIKRYFAADIGYERTIAPIDLVPPGVRELEVKLLDKGKMYQLSFRV